MVGFRSNRWKSIHSYKMQWQNVKYQYLAAMIGDLKIHLMCVCFFILWIMFFSSVNLVSIGFGIFRGWTAPSIILLTSDDNPLPTGKLSMEQASWVASLHTIGILFGNIFCGWIMNNFGRRLPLILIAFPLIVSNSKEHHCKRAIKFPMSTILMRSHTKLIEGSELLSKSHVYFDQSRIKINCWPVDQLASDLVCPKSILFVCGQIVGRFFQRRWFNCTRPIVHGRNIRQSVSQVGNAIECYRNWSNKIDNFYGVFFMIISEYEDF